MIVVSLFIIIYTINSSIINEKSITPNKIISERLLTRKQTLLLNFIDVCIIILKY